jgi:hypothetical protein
MHPIIMSQSPIVQPRTASAPISSVGHDWTVDVMSVPAHAAGDLIVCFCRASGAGTPPGTPAGWTSHASSASTISSAWRLISKIDSDNTLNTLSFAGVVAAGVGVYRGTSGIGAVAADADDNLGESAAVPSLSLNVGSGTSWVGAVAECNQTRTFTNSTGMTYRMDNASTGGGEANWFDSNGGVSSYTGGNATWTGQGDGYWTTVVFELLQA